MPTVGYCLKRHRYELGPSSWKHNRLSNHVARLIIHGMIGCVTGNSWRDTCSRCVVAWRSGRTWLNRVCCHCSIDHWLCAEPVGATRIVKPPS
jgi:hypothetical protein